MQYFVLVCYAKSNAVTSFIGREREKTKIQLQFALNVWSPYIKFEVLWAILIIKKKKK